MTTLVSSIKGNQVELYGDNPDPRCLLALLLDISSSMEGAAIDALNEGIVNLARDLAADSIAQNRIEPAIITFGGTVTVHTKFGPVNEFKPEAYEAKGSTPMGEAILVALKLIEERKEIFKAQGIEYYRPVMLVITDGKPTDEKTFAQAVIELRDAEAKKKVDFYSVGVLGADMSLLKRMDTKNSPVYLKGVEFTTLFKYVSSSIAAVSPEDGQINMKLS